MPWSYTLHSESISKSIQEDWQRRAALLGLSHTTSYDRSSNMADDVPTNAAMLENAARSGPVSSFKAEEVLGKFAIVRLRNPGKNDDFTYAYIQGAVKNQQKVELNVIFIYLPSETICLDGYYPNGDELFLSDDCSCSFDGIPILLTDVVRLVEVTIGEKVHGAQDFFVRRKYVHAENVICRLKESDFQCSCRRSNPPAGQELIDQDRTPLSGLGLFAGCGNFDFGLEAFGAVKFVAAVEMDETALKTYAANRLEGSNGLVLDSVNPCLSKILSANLGIPGISIGSIDFISAGSPCKGFSRINPRRGDDKGMRNCSLVASTLSYIETLLPKYAILENVSAMGSGVGNSCNQIIACLVGLGYQIRKTIWNARDSGSPQNRDRLFIIAASPNVPLPQNLEACCNLTTGYTKASIVSQDLPYMDNDDSICILYPDHIPGARQTPMFRELIRQIPRFPKCMNFLKSIKQRCQRKAQLEWSRSNRFVKNTIAHTAFTRLDPDGFIPTITTSVRPSCGWGGGRILHWDEHRTLTLLEARRAQGFPDNEVIIGDLPQQWAQVGNAVDRRVAAALGKVVADAWFSKTNQINQSTSSSGEVDPSNSHWLNNDKMEMEQDEVEFVKELFQPAGRNPSSHNQHSSLQFSQIQRREISTIKQGPSGEEQSIQVIAERSIELRTKTPPLSPFPPSSSAPGSQEHPIEVETEVTVSRRRKRESSPDDEEEDDEEGVRRWVGKRGRLSFVG